MSVAQTMHSRLYDAFHHLTVQKTASYLAQLPVIADILPTYFPVLEGMAPDSQVQTRGRALIRQYASRYDKTGGGDGIP